MIEYVTLEGPDPDAAQAFYTDALDLGERVRVRASNEPATGFRGYTMSLVVPQPSDVDALIDDAIGGGATIVKPAAKSFWGYGGVVQAPDGAIWQMASSSKKDSGPATRAIEDVVLLLGVSDVKASKQFYVDHGLTVKRSFGGKYAEFEGSAAPITLALYGRRALAKTAGVAPEGAGSRRMVIGGSGPAFTDPDGFSWETADQLVAEAV